MNNLFIDSIHHSGSLCKEIAQVNLGPVAPFAHNGSATAQVLEKLRQHWEQEIVELDKKSASHATSVGKFLDSIHAIENGLHSRLGKML